MAIRPVSFGGSGVGRGGAAGDPSRPANEAGPSTERVRPRNDHRPPKRKMGASRTSYVLDDPRSPAEASKAILVQGELDMDSSTYQLEEATP